MKLSFKKMLIAIFSSCLFFSTVAIASAHMPTDISGHWAENTLEKWIFQDDVEGYADGTIKPNNNIRRSEVAAMINRTFNYEDKVNIRFNDVASSDWFYNDIAIASAAGYIKGNPDGSFEPRKEISRQELAVIISSILNLDASDSYLNFEDTKNSPNWSKGQIGAVIDAGVMTGYPDGTFLPTESATRAEVMVMLEKALLLNGDDRVIHYNKAGTFGPESGRHTIEGDVIVQASDVTLQNLTITGDLILAEGIGEGDAFIHNVTVKGNTSVEGGGVNSIHFENSILATITVNKKTNPVRIVVTGNSTVTEVVLQSSAKLEESDNSTGTGFGNVTLSELLPDDSNVELAGSFETVDIQAKTVHLTIPKGLLNQVNVSENADNTNIDISEEASIANLVLDSNTHIVGQGEIEKAKINVSGSTIEKEPTTTDIKSGVTVEIAGKEVKQALPVDNGGGSTSSAPSVVQVSAIAVIGADSVTSVVYGETLQMSAALTPENATNQTINWSVEPGTGTATIDATTGLLTATGVGNVTVKATNAASGVTGSLTVNVDSIKITTAALSITAPVRGATPQTAAEIEAATVNTDYTVSSATWNEALSASGKFKAGQAYTLTVVLTSKGAKEFQADAFTPIVANAASVGMTTTSAPGAGNTVSFDVTYAATPSVTKIEITRQPSLSYIEPMPFNLIDMEVKETYSDGSTSLVTFTEGTAEGYTTSLANGTTLTTADNGRVITITHVSSGLTASTGSLSVISIIIPPIIPPIFPPMP